MRNNNGGGGAPYPYDPRRSTQSQPEPRRGAPYDPRRSTQSQPEHRRGAPYDPRRSTQSQPRPTSMHNVVTNTGRGVVEERISVARANVQRDSSMRRASADSRPNANNVQRTHSMSMSGAAPAPRQNNVQRAHSMNMSSAPAGPSDQSKVHQRINSINSMRTSNAAPRSNFPRANSMRRPTPTNTTSNNPTWFNENTQPPTQNENLQRTSQQRPQQRSRKDDDDRTMTTMQTMQTKDVALKPSAMGKAKDLTPPQRDITIIYTDVQGSTALWEACPNDMKAAQDIHDLIIRQCYANHSGYEITTEGDAFNLAFQHPVDALAFALQAQLKLYKADWPEAILKHPDGKNEPALKFRGFRVRFGIHHGPASSYVHKSTERMSYSGEAIKVAKALEGMCHGGQILTTMETWKAVSGMAERYLGRPQILDCGEHFLFETKTPNPGTSTGYTTTPDARRIVQLVPSEMAFDFFEARGRREVPSGDGKKILEVKDASTISGRLFPPVLSKRQLTTSFLNAPYTNGRVTICFVYTVGLGDDPSHNNGNMTILASHVRKRLLGMNPPGYECQEDNGCWMLAFDRMVNAVFFGLQLKAAVQRTEGLRGNVDRGNMFKVGILSGPFTSMGPHRTTGMADYFGPIVNRAARVASNCQPGQVCVGIPLSEGVTADPPDFGSAVNVRLQEIKKLKGITIDVAIFSCSMSNEITYG